MSHAFSSDVPLPELTALTIDDICKRLRVSRAHVYAEIARGRLKTAKSGSRRLVTYKQLAEYFALIEREGERTGWVSR